MSDIRKWNFETHEYEPYIPPDGIIVLYSHDMDLPINCTSCGKPMVFGEGYTSRQLHTSMGLGYPVCQDCYNNEWAEERKHEHEK